MKCVFRGTGWECIDWMNVTWVTGSCEHSNEASDYIKWDRGNNG